MHLKIGSTTDDWAFTKAVAESIIGCHGYNHENQVNSHIQVLHSNIPGMGNTTWEGLTELDQHFKTGGLQGRRPELPATRKPGRGLGNGVAMKAAPLGLLKSMTSKPTDIANQESLNILNMFSKITHGDDIAVITALLITETIDWVIKKPIENKADALTLLNWLLKQVKDLETNYTNTDAQVKVSDQLIILKDNIDNPERVYQLIGPGFLATQSCLMALDGFTRYPTNFRKAVLTAVNNGGDTDTIASMTGAMCGTNVGINGIPSEWLNFGHGQFQQAAELGGKLYLALTSES